MTKIEIQNKIQDEAVTKWVENNGIGSCIATQAFGKSFVLYKSIYKALSLNWIKLGDTIFIFSFTQAQGKNLKKEADVFHKIKKLNPLEDFNIKFHCYQSLPKGDRIFDAYDEGDAAISPSYGRNITESPAKYKLLLTGTESANKNIYRDRINEGLHGEIYQSDEATENGEVTDFINKGQFLDIYCPVVFTYTREQALNDNIIAKMQTIIINHSLSKKPNRIKIWKSYETMGSEEDWWNSKDNRRKDFRVPYAVKGLVGKEMSKFLYNIPSKAIVAKKALELIKGQTIIFGVELPLLSMITPNVITSKNSTSFTLNEKYYSTTSKNIYKSFNLKTGKERIIYKSEFDKQAVKLSLTDVSEFSSNTRRFECKSTKIYKCRHLLSLRQEEIAEEIYKTEKQKWLSVRLETDYLLDAFNKGEISNIASAKAIGRGMTLNNVENTLVVSFQKSNTAFSQKIARMWRTDNLEDKVGNLYLVKTLNTFEDTRWFPEITKVKGKKGKLQEELDLNITKEITSMELFLPGFKF